LGETYTPTIITEEQYQDILSESSSTGNTETSTTPGVCDGTGPNA
jgi:hypothetical protein